MITRQRHRLRFAPLFATLAGFVGSSVPAAIMPDIAIARNNVNDAVTISWYGETGHTYFVQHSLDLRVWLTAPVIETGNDLPLAWSVQANPERGFYRILFTDLATGGDPETTDFDGDGLSNLLETTLGSHPLSLDSDRDGMPDAWEYLHGLGLTTPGDAFANLDDDALSNLAEFLAGTDPSGADGDVLSAALALTVTSP